MGWGIKQPGLRFLSPASGHVPGTDLGPATSLWHQGILAQTRGAAGNAFCEPSHVPHSGPYSVPFLLP